MASFETLFFGLIMLAFGWFMWAIKPISVPLVVIGIIAVWFGLKR